MVVLRRWLFNLLHVPAYAGLTLLLAWTISGAARPRRLGALLLACVAALSIGVTTELLQQYVPGRYPTLLDALLNAGGCGLAVWLVVRTRWFGRGFGRLADRSESLTEKTTG